MHTLKEVKIASQYRSTTDGMRFLTSTVSLLKETKTQYINLGFARVKPVAEKCSDLPLADQATCNTRGYSFERLANAVSVIKTSIPDIIIGGSVSSEFLNPECRNEETGEAFTKDQTWNMALDPGKWGIPTTKEDFQTSVAVSHGWAVQGQPYDPKNQMLYYFPDQSNADYQKLFLSWVKRQIDYGITSILIDINTKQARLMAQLTGDVNHISVKAALAAASEIVDDIHNYGVEVISWATDILLSSSFAMKNLDAVMTTPSTQEIETLTMDDVKWNAYILAIKQQLGNVPIFVMFDQGPDYRPLEAFGQKLTIDQANQFLRIIDSFCKAKGMVFIYPIHGGIMGSAPAVKSYGTYNWYDSLAPEFNTYDTIKQLAQATIPSVNIGDDIHSYRITGVTTDRFYTTPLSGATLTTAGLVANTMVAIPFITPNTINLDEIAINITAGTAGASSTRLGIYIDNGNLYPGSLILDAGTVDSSAAGGGGVKTIIINQKLIKSTLYWLVAVSDGTPGLRAASIAATLPILGYPNTLPTTPGVGYAPAFIFAPLPDPFPAGANTISTNIPLIYVRLLT
ncbi:MAG: hypothetical protein PHZ02_01580 [Desulfocapsaceae bacterium]|nr:hypothetical protein [Desulfocapsaceae bacterium]